jgi:Beta-lactamase enzyme family
MRSSAWRVIAGAAITVTAAFVLFVALGGFRSGSPAPAPAVSSPSASAAADATERPGNSPTSPSASPAGTSASPAPPVSPLAGAAAYARDRSGALTAAVYDIKTGQTWQLGGGPPQAEASVVKLDILETLLARQGGAGLSSGDQALTRSMIEDSDNDAATSLWDADGGAPGLSAYDDEAGLTGTTPSACVDCAGFAWPGWGLTTTVPGDQLALLRQLVAPGAHPLLSAAERSYGLSLMENVASDQRWGVSGGVPAGVTVALKNGWLPLDAADSDWQVNSVGWVSGDGRDYLVAVLSTGNPTEQYGIDTISHLSALVWSALR